MDFTAGKKLRASELNYNTSTGTDCQYTSTAAQSLANLQNVRMLFPTADRETSLVTRTASGTGHTFTLNRSGIWAVSATVRTVAVAGGGERFLAARTTAGDHLVAIGQPVAANAGQPSTMTISKDRWMASGTILEIVVFQSSGAAVNTDVALQGMVRVNLCWLKD